MPSSGVRGRRRPVQSATEQDRLFIVQVCQLCDQDETTSDPIDVWWLPDVDDNEYSEIVNAHERCARQQVPAAELLSEVEKQWEDPFD